MNYLTDSNAFRHHLSIIERLIMRDKRLPERLFKKQLSYFVYIDFDEILSKSFIGRMKSFLNAIGEERYFLAVIEPEPEGYYFSHFGKYPIIEIALDDTEEEYLAILNDDPGDSPADAINYNGRVILVYSTSASWAIYGERDFELGVVGFMEEQLRTIFTSAYGSDRIFNVAEATKQLLRAVPFNFRNQLITNYNYSHKGK